MEWRTVKQFSDYEVSSFGLVRRATRGTHKDAGQCLQQSEIEGYKIVCLFRKGKRKYMRVNRLVAEAFLPEPKPEQNQVAHLDGSRSNNKISNLTWATCKENLSHRAIHGTEIIGSRNGRAKLTEDQVIEIRARYRPRDRINGATAMAKEFGVTDVAICKVISRENWSRF